MFKHLSKRNVLNMAKSNLTAVSLLRPELHQHSRNAGIYEQLNRHRTHQFVVGFTYKQSKTQFNRRKSVVLPDQWSLFVRQVTTCKTIRHKTKTNNDHKDKNQWHYRFETTKSQRSITKGGSYRSKVPTNN